MIFHIFPLLFIVEEFQTRLAVHYEDRQLKELVKIRNDPMKPPVVIWFKIQPDFQEVVLEPLARFKGCRLLGIFIEENLNSKLQEIERIRMSSSNAQVPELYLDNINDEIYQPAFFKMQEIYDKVKRQQYKFEEMRKVVIFLKSPAGVGTELTEIARGSFILLLSVIESKRFSFDNIILFYVMKILFLAIHVIVFSLPF